MGKQLRQVAKFTRLHRLVGTTINHDVILTIGVQGNGRAPRSMILVDVDVTSINIIFFQRFQHVLAFVIGTHGPDECSLRTGTGGSYGLISPFATGS